MSTPETRRPLIDRKPWFIHLVIGLFIALLVAKWVGWLGKPVPLAIMSAGLFVLGVGVTVTFVRRPVNDRDVEAARANVALGAGLVARLPRGAQRGVLIFLGVFITLLGLIGTLGPFV